MTSKCKGCHTHDGNECMNGLPSERNGWKCPCIKCIVKPMCTTKCVAMARYDYYVNHRDYHEHVYGWN